MPVKAAPAAVVTSHWFIDASIDGVYARRNQSSAILLEDTVSGGQILNASQLDYPDRLGLDARLRVGTGPWSIEGGYRYLDFAGAVFAPDLIGNVDVLNSTINTNQSNLRIQAATFGVRAKFP